jgi:hypothetical protein
MWQAGERKTGVGKAHFLGVVGEHPVGRLDHKPVVLADSLPARFLNAVVNDQAVNLRH